MSERREKSLRKAVYAKVLEVLELVPQVHAINWQTCVAAAWRRDRGIGRLVAHATLSDIVLSDLLFVEDQKAQLAANTEQFIAGLPSNNVLLWGARGTGKSSLVHALLQRYADAGLRLVEVHKDELRELANIAQTLADEPFRFIVFCDDLSFEVDDPSYKELKSALEGSIFKASTNVLIYATSNRRHLVPEFMADNLQAKMVDGELHESEAVEEKISLSDRFGLWLSFYPFRQDAYLDVVTHWVSRLADQHNLQLDAGDEEMRAQALRWALARGVRNGRTAQYFARHWVGTQALTQKS